MTLIEQIISEAKASNISLYIKDDQLAFIAEQGGFPSELKAKISKYKKDIIIALLSMQESSLRTDIVPFALLTDHERAAFEDRYEDAYPMSTLQAGVGFPTPFEELRRTLPGLAGA